MKIGNREIGGNNPTYIIAEAGTNHMGDVVRACDLVDDAAEAGADAIKFQAFKNSRTSHLIRCSVRMKVMTDASNTGTTLACLIGIGAK
jgi:sialic acid synthase SpsE